MERIYWGIAILVAAGLLFVGAQFFPPLLTGLHVLVCVLLMLVVLLQSGRAADLAGAFGGAGSQTAFGPRGAATFLSNATTFLAILFMATSLLLVIHASRGVSTVAGDSTPASTQQTNPAPAPPAQQQQQTPPPPSSEPPK